MATKQCLLIVGGLVASLVMATGAWAQGDLGAGDPTGGGVLPPGVEMVFGDGIPDGEQDINHNGIPDGREDQDQDGILDGDADKNRNGIPDGQEDRLRLEAQPGSPSAGAQPAPGQVPGQPAPGGVAPGTEEAPGAPTRSATEALEAEEQISFKADTQRVLEDSKVLELEGNVTVFFRDMTFFADYVRVDDSTKTFYGLGNAELRMPDRQVFGDSFWYDYGRDDFKIVKAWGQFDGGLGEMVHFVAKEIRGNVKDFKLVDTTLSTCTPEETQEWHIRASMAKILPDKKVIMRNAFFYILGVPIFWFPYYDFNLEDTPVKIDVGKNRQEGTYVKVLWNYLYEPEHRLRGSIFTAYRSRLGYLITTDHAYALHGTQWPGTLKTTFDFLTQDKGIKVTTSFDTSQQFRITSELDGRISANQRNTPRLQQGSRSESAGANGNLSYRDEKGSSVNTNYSFSQQKSGTNSETGNLTLGVDGAYVFSDHLRFNGRMNYSSASQQPGLANDQRLDLSADVTASGLGAVNWTVSYAQNLDPDGNRVARKFEGDLTDGGGNTQPNPTDPGNDTQEGDPPDQKLSDPDSNSQTLQELPKIVVTVGPGHLGKGKNWHGIESQQTRFTFAHYVQRRPDRRINTLYADWDTSWRRDWNVSDTNRVNATFGYRQSFTGTGDGYYTISPGISWERTESDLVRQSFRYTYSDSEGASPITNAVGGGNSSSLSWNLNYRATRMDYSLTTGRDFSRNTWSPLTFNSTYTPHPGLNDWSVTFQTGYDLEGGDLRPFVWGFKYDDVTNSPRRLSSSMNFTYDYKESQITTLENTTKWRINDTMWTDFRLAYDTIGSETAILRELTLSRLNDCTYFQLRYNALADSIIFNVGITAAWQKALAFGSNAGNEISDPFSQFGDGFAFSGTGGSGLGGTFGGGSYGGF